MMGERTETLEERAVERDITKAESQLTPAIEKRLKAGNLTAEERMLINLRDDPKLPYEGSFAVMYAKLTDKLGDRPYIWRIVNRIKEDRPRVVYMREFEQKYKCNLAGIVARADKKLYASKT